MFLSYAREDAEQARQLAEAVQHAGHEVWWDQHIRGGSRFAREIDGALKNADAVVVLWSEESVESAWVQDEAAEGRDRGRLVPVLLGSVRPPLGFRQFQSIDLSGSETLGGARQMEQLITAIEAVAGCQQAEDLPALREQPRAKRPTSACVMVMPFANMSGDPEQEYFSDGISEDITTDLAKVSALTVVGRNTAFTFKGQPVDVTDVARKLGLSHVLQGSVRKAGSRVRITAQLIDGSSGDHVWAERYDRDLTDIFVLQDEITKEIVSALRLKLLPEEQKAIEQRGTSSTDAYDVYLMARQYWITGNDGDPRRDEIILRLCHSAIDADPDYARAWALLALTQSGMHFRNRDLPENGVAAADRAIALDPTLAEPHCVKARDFALRRQFEEANAQIEIALRLDPDSWEVNKEVGFVAFRQGEIGNALRYFRKAAELMETDYRSAGMMVTCGRKLSDVDATLDGARMTVKRAEKVLEQDRSNGSALAWGVVGLAELGEIARAKDWMRKALLVDPNNLIMRYNLACVSVMNFKDHDTALQLLEPYLTSATESQLGHVQFDPDLDQLRPHLRFEAMISKARERLGIPGPAIGR